MNQTTTTPAPTPTPNRSPFDGRRNRRSLMSAGAVGLGVAGMLLLGVVMIDDQGDPIDQPSPDLAEDVIREGVDADFDPFDPDPDPLDDIVIGGGEGDDDVIIGGWDGDDVISGGDPGDDGVLIGGDPADDVLIGGDDDILIVGDDGSDLLDDPFGPPSDGHVLLPDEPTETGLKTLCAETKHVSPPGKEALAKSGILIDGTLYGLPEGSWIWIQGSTLDNGEGQKIPVIDGAFSAPLGINDFGAHPIEQFQLMYADPSIPPVDLLPAAQDAFGASFEVGPEEGPTLDGDGGCLAFDPIIVHGDVPAGESPYFGEPTAATNGGGEMATARSFMEHWADAHRRGDADELFGTLHRIVPLAFGEDECRDYIAATTGSIVDAEVLDAEPIGAWEFDTPTGPMAMSQVITFDVELTTNSGDVISTEGHLPVADDGTVSWLTTCGVELP